jgi:hypothetical protein
MEVLGLGLFYCLGPCRSSSYLSSFYRSRPYRPGPFGRLNFSPLDLIAWLGLP